MTGFEVLPGVGFEVVLGSSGLMSRPMGFKALCWFEAC